MSLEAALAENTAAVHKLIAVLQSGAVGVAGTVELASQSAAEAPRRGRPKKGEPDTQPTAGSDAQPSLLGTVNDGKSLSIKLVAGDPEGTRYVHIAKHRTVAAIRPGETFPSIEGTVECDGAEYLALKATYSPPLAQVAPASQPVATPASATPAATAASSSTPAASAALDGPAILAKCKAVHAAQGNDGLKAVLDKFGATRVPDLVAATAKHAEIAAFIDSLLNPQPVTAAEPNLFG